MEILILILIIAACVGGVVWNHRNRADAVAGVEFHLPEPPSAVSSAIAAIYCQGAKATLRSTVFGVSVRQRAASGFSFETKLGDEGEIEVHPGPGSGTTVRARTSTVYIGGKLTSDRGSGIWVVSKALTHLFARMLGLSPNAAKMKRFQNGLEGRITKQVARQVGA